MTAGFKILSNAAPIVDTNLRMVVLNFHNMNVVAVLPFYQDISIYNCDTYAIAIFKIKSVKK
jgi:hypothetical protein